MKVKDTKKSIINILTLFFILGGILIIIVTFFSSSQKTYECVDAMDSRYQTQNNHVYLQINTYRPWVWLWEPNYQGTILIDWEKVSNKMTNTKFVENSNLLEFKSLIGGQFKKLSQKVVLNTTINKKEISFKGHCKILEK